VTVAVTVVDAQRNAIPGLSCKLAIDDGTVAVGTYQDFRCFFLIPPERIGWGAELMLSAPNFANASTSPKTWANLGPDRVELPRLVPHAQVLRQAYSSYFTVIETSEFQLLRLLCTGDEPPVKQLIQLNADAGFNALRVFMMFNNGPIRNRRDDPAPQPNDPGSGGLGRFVPSECNDFWGKALRLLDLASLVRMYVEYTIFADHVILDASSQLAFWANVDSILGTRGNVLVEAVNEADLAINRLEAQNQLPRPTRVTASHGRKGSDQLPVAPGFDYIRK